jgi:hypothetical protein
MKDGFLGAHWSGDEKINALANCAGGLFIWASTAYLYIESHNPEQRLSELIDKQSESNSSGPFATGQFVQDGSAVRRFVE